MKKLNSLFYLKKIFRLNNSQELSCHLSNKKNYKNNKNPIFNIVIYKSTQENFHGWAKLTTILLQSQGKVASWTETTSQICSLDSLIYGINTTDTRLHNCISSILIQNKTLTKNNLKQSFKLSTNNQKFQFNLKKKKKKNLYKNNIYLIKIINTIIKSFSNSLKKIQFILQKFKNSNFKISNLFNIDSYWLNSNQNLTTISIKIQNFLNISNIVKKFEQILFDIFSKWKKTFFSFIFPNNSNIKQVKKNFTLKFINSICAIIVKTFNERETMLFQPNINKLMLNLNFVSSLKSKQSFQLNNKIKNCLKKSFKLSKTSCLVKTFCKCHAIVALDYCCKALKTQSFKPKVYVLFQKILQSKKFKIQKISSMFFIQNLLNTLKILKTFNFFNFLTLIFIKKKTMIFNKNYLNVLQNKFLKKKRKFALFLFQFFFKTKKRFIKNYINKFFSNVNFLKNKLNFLFIQFFLELQFSIFNFLKNYQKFTIENSFLHVFLQKLNIKKKEMKKITAILLPPNEHSRLSLGGLEYFPECSLGKLFTVFFFSVKNNFWKRSFILTNKNKNTHQAKKIYQVDYKKDFSQIEIECKYTQVKKQKNFPFSFNQLLKCSFYIKEKLLISISKVAKNKTVNLLLSKNLILNKSIKKNNVFIFLKFIKKNIQLFFEYFLNLNRLKTHIDFFQNWNDFQIIFHQQLKFLLFSFQTKIQKNINFSKQNLIYSSGYLTFSSFLNIFPNFLDRTINGQHQLAIAPTTVAQLCDRCFVMKSQSFITKHQSQSYITKHQQPCCLSKVQKQSIIIIQKNKNYSFLNMFHEFYFVYSKNLSSLCIESRYTQQYFNKIHQIHLLNTFEKSCYETNKQNFLFLFEKIKRNQKIAFDFFVTFFYNLYFYFEKIFFHLFKNFQIQQIKNFFCKKDCFFNFEMFNCFQNFCIKNKLFKNYLLDPIDLIFKCYYENFFIFYSNIFLFSKNQKLLQLINIYFSKFKILNKWFLNFFGFCNSVMHSNWNIGCKYTQKNIKIYKKNHFLKNISFINIFKLFLINISKKQRGTQHLLQFQKIFWFISNKVIFWPTKLNTITYFSFSTFLSSFLSQKYQTFILSNQKRFREKKFSKNFLYLNFDGFSISLRFTFQNNSKVFFFFEKTVTTKNINTHLKECQQIIKNSIGKKQLFFMKKLQTKMKIWCKKYNKISTKKIFYYCDSMLLKFLWSWAKKTHPNKNKFWIRKKYFHFLHSNKWFFGKKVGKMFICLPLHSQTKIQK